MKDLMPWLGGDERWGREKLVINGELCLRENKSLEGASSLWNILHHDKFYFLIQPSNFSNSDNQDPFYIIGVFEPDALAPVFWIFCIKVHPHFA